MTAGEEVVVLDLGCSDLVEQVEKVRRTVQHISFSYFDYFDDRPGNSKVPAKTYLERYFYILHDEFQ